MGQRTLSIAGGLLLLALIIPAPAYAEWKLYCSISREWLFFDYWQAREQPNYDPGYFELTFDNKTLKAIQHHYDTDTCEYNIREGIHCTQPYPVKMVGPMFRAVVPDNKKKDDFFLDETLLKIYYYLGKPMLYAVTAEVASSPTREGTAILTGFCDTDYEKARAKNPW